MTPLPFRGRRARARHGRHVDAHARAARRRRARRRAGPVHDGLRLRDRRGADLGQRPAEPPRPGRPHRARRRRRSRSAICAAEPGSVLGLRGPFGNSWPIDDAAGGDVVVVAGGIGLAPLRPVVLRALERRARLRRRGRPLRRAHARRPALPRAARRVAEHARRVDVRSTPPAATGRAASASFRSSSPARTSARSARRRSCAGPEIMMHYTIEALARARRPRRSGSRSRWSATWTAASGSAATASSARR